MADIRKRHSSKGISYQVRFADSVTKSGFGYKSFTTWKAAQAFKAEHDLEEARLGPSLGNSGGSLSSSGLMIRAVPDAIDHWLDICERVGRDGREPIEAMTLVEYRRRAAVMRRYAWTKVIQHLEPTDIVRFRTWLLETVSRDLARRTLSSFHSVLIEMKRQGIIRDDPGAGITIRAGGRYEEDSEVEIPSDQELRDILGAADVMGSKNTFMEGAWARYRPLLYLAAFSGMRSSELRGLPWAHLHATHVEIRQRADGRGTIGPVKTRAGRRRVELAAQVTDMLFGWRARCPASELDLVFPTATGRPIFANNLRQDCWLPVLREAGLTYWTEVKGRDVERPRYTPHALRHYYASKLIDKKKDAKFIQERLGHSSIEITFNVYGHLMKDREAAHRQTAEELVADLLLV
ncbi:MAG: site-specific integrase [Pseudomonadota bacterium]